MTNEIETKISLANYDENIENLENIKKRQNEITCPHCKRASKKIDRIKYNYCPYCGKSLSFIES